MIFWYYLIFTKASFKRPCLHIQRDKRSRNCLPSYFGNASNEGSGKPVQRGKSAQGCKSGQRHRLVSVLVARGWDKY